MAERILRSDEEHSSSGTSDREGSAVLRAPTVLGGAWLSSGVAHSEKGTSMRPCKLVTVIAAIALASVALTSIASAAPSASIKIAAKLTAKAEVPAQVVKNANGSGSFTATLTGNKLAWKLTFAKLSGPAIAAHIHLGKAGKAGNVAVALCAGAKCKSGVHGTSTLSAATLKAVTSGGAYVNVHTAKNPNGEIRGQLTP